MISERNISLGLLSFAGIAILLSYVAGASLGIIATVLLFLALLAAPLSFIIFKYGYWLIPYFTKGQRTITTQEAVVEIPPTDDVVIKKEAGSFYATVYMGVKIYKTTTSMSDDEKFGFQDLWERAVSGIKSVAKYSVLVYIKDLSKYKESIEARKAKAQMELASEREKPDPNASAIDKIEREISMWDGILSRLELGEKPTAISTFVQITAKGATKDSAIASVRTLANAVRSTMGTALNVEVVPLSGEDMRRCFDWQYAIPPTVKEI